MTEVCSTTGCGTGSWNGPLPGDPDNSSILSAVSEFGGIQVSWTLPSSNAHAVAYTQIYRSIVDEFETAIPFTAVAGTSYFDYQAALVIRPYYYWIQHISVNGTVLDPIGPAMAVAKPQIDQVIAALTGRIESSSLADSLRSRIDVITDLEAGLTQINNTVVAENQVFAQQLLALQDTLSDALAYVDSQQTISANAQQALVTSLNTQLAQLSDGLYASIQDEATTRADETGDLFAQKTLKIDLAGNVAGYGLSARVDPTGEFTSDFQVRADTFSIAPPAVSRATEPDNPYNGMIWVDTSTTPNITKWYNDATYAWQTTPVRGAVPFIVKSTPEIIDGYTVPAGVYIDSAYITRLQANQIDTRGLEMRDMEGNIILSAGTALDWSMVGGSGRPADGATVGAPAGTYVGGVLVEDLLASVASSAGGETKLSKAGDTITGRINLAVADGLFAGTDLNNGVYLGNGGLVGKKAGVTTFAISTTGDAIFGGSLDGASGTFSGTLTADAIDAVKTVNIAGDAIIVPARGEYYAAGATDVYQAGFTAVTLPAIVFPAAGRVVLFIRWWVQNVYPWVSRCGGFRVYEDSTVVYDTGLISYSSTGAEGARNELPMFTIARSVAAGTRTYSIWCYGSNGTYARAEQYFELTIVSIKK